MDTAIHKEAIHHTFLAITTRHRKEKAVDQEQLVNNFLDSIIALRHLLNEQAATYESLDEMLTKLTWVDHDELAEEDYQNLRELLKESQALYELGECFYTLLKPSLEDGLLKQEISRYWESIDCFRESY